MAKKKSPAKGSKAAENGNAFDHAARLLRVPSYEFKLWLIDVYDATPSQWSQWKTGRRGISGELLKAFMEYRLEHGEQWITELDARPPRNED